MTEEPDDRGVAGDAPVVLNNSGVASRDRVAQLSGTVMPVHLEAHVIAGLNVRFHGWPDDMTFDSSLASTYNPAFVTANGGSVAAAEAALAASLAADTSYLNIHTQTSPGGEIRGFLVRVPDRFSTAWAALPFTALLFAAGIRKSGRLPLA